MKLRFAPRAFWLTDFKLGLSLGMEWSGSPALVVWLGLAGFRIGFDSYIDEGGNMRFEYYQDSKGEWRWTLFASNGRIVADSAEGYTRKEGVQDAISRVQLESASAYVKERPLTG